MANKSVNEILHTGSRVIYVIPHFTEHVTDVIFQTDDSAWKGVVSYGRNCIEGET